MKNLRLIYLLVLFIVFPSGVIAITVVLNSLGFFDPGRYYIDDIEIWIVVFILAAWAFLIQILLKMFKCPRCRRLLYPFDKEMEWRFLKAIFPEKRCRNCGYDLQRKTSGMRK